jgi:hypothetical protein
MRSASSMLSEAHYSPYRQGPSQALFCGQPTPTRNQCENTVSVFHAQSNNPTNNTLVDPDGNLSWLRHWLSV